MFLKISQNPQENTCADVSVISFSKETPAQVRSSHQRCSIIKGVLRNFTKFTGKHLRQSLFFNKVAGLRPATLFKKSPWHRCFPVNLVKFFRTTFLQNTAKRLLLTFPCNSPIKKNLSDVSTIGCLLFLGNFPNKRQQLNLCFTLRLQSIFNYLKSQNE